MSAESGLFRRSSTYKRARGRCCNQGQCSACRFTESTARAGLLVPHRAFGCRLELPRALWSRKERNNTSSLCLPFEVPRFQIPWYMQPYTSGGNHCNNETDSYVLQLPCFRIEESAHDRAVYFSIQQREVAVLHGDTDRPDGRQASSISDLMVIRAVHSKLFRRLSLGTGLGFRTRGSQMTEIPAIVVFVARKLNAQWVLEGQMLPRVLQGPGSVWCDVDVVEFSYHGAPTPVRQEQFYSELVELLRGNSAQIGPGSQVASMEVYGTLGALVRSITGKREVGFITNRHVAVDLDYPSQKIFHPLPPNLGPGMYLGAVKRAASFVTDCLWYGMYASSSPEGKRQQ